MNQPINRSGLGCATPQSVQASQVESSRGIPLRSKSDRAHSPIRSAIAAVLTRNKSSLNHRLLAIWLLASLCSLFGWLYSSYCSQNAKKSLIENASNIAASINAVTESTADLATIQRTISALSRLDGVDRITLTREDSGVIVAATDLNLVGHPQPREAIVSDCIEVSSSKLLSFETSSSSINLSRLTVRMQSETESTRFQHNVKNLLLFCFSAGLIGLFFSRSRSFTARNSVNSTESSNGNRVEPVRVRSQRRAMDDSQFDYLTQLPSRIQIQNCIQSCIDSGLTNYSVLFLDLKRFKIVNDILGHEAGDKLLCEVAQRLRAYFEDTNPAGLRECESICARLGGDKFVVLLRNSTQVHMKTLVENLDLILSKPYWIGRQVVHSTVCFGVVHGNEVYRHAMEVLRDAETALFEAKGQSKTCIAFDDSMRERLTRRQLLENELYHAIERKEVFLQYQPIIDLTTGKVHSLEALCRWQHSQLGFVCPAEFIPIAEETGVISKIGAWVFDEACSQFANWLETIGENCTAMISVNLSRHQLVDPDLISMVRDTLQRYSLSPARIELEITENTIAEDLEQASRTLTELKALGIRLALDDFGIGISSFASLHRFPVDTLKVDRSLTNDLLASPEAVALVQGLIVISEGMQIDLVVEGVETQGQLELLRHLGCDLGQGYLFSKPLSTSKIREFLANDCDRVKQEA